MHTMSSEVIHCVASVHFQFTFIHIPAVIEKLQKISDMLNKNSLGLKARPSKIESEVVCGTQDG